MVQYFHHNMQFSPTPTPSYSLAMNLASSVHAFHASYLHLIGVNCRPSVHIPLVVKGQIQYFKETERRRNRQNLWLVFIRLKANKRIPPIICMCPNHSWQACIHKWTQGWCQVANILCRERVRSKRRGGSKQPTSDACLVEPCGVRPAWGELLALLHLKAAQSISAITTVCPPAFSSLSLSMLMLQAGVWCMMRFQGTWVAWRAHMSSLMPWCFGH